MEQTLKVYLDETFEIDGIEINVHALHNGRGILMLGDGADAMLVNIETGGHIMPENGRTAVQVLDIDDDHLVLKLTKMTLQ